VAEAGPVPIIGQPYALPAAGHLVRLRWRRVARLAAARSMSAALGGGCAGAAGGLAGGLLLAATSAGGAPLTVAAVLAAIGGAVGAAGGLGVGGGVSIAEVLVRSHRTLALLLGGACGGACVGSGTQFLGAATLAVLVHVDLQLGGAVEGLALGAAAGLAFASTTRGDGGVAAPRGRERRRTLAAVLLACGLTALALSLAGRTLVGGTLHAIAQAAAGGTGLLAPLGRLIGEPGFGPITAALISMGEGAAFGLGLAAGLTRRG
jgi:hypothetical protein